MPEETVRKISDAIAQTIRDRISNRRDAPTLRMSNLGTSCDRKLWYSVKHPELGEPLSGPVHFKFLYGDILERVVLGLAEIAGHTVEGEQDELIVEGVKGHRDAVIDGRLIDVKSATTHSFQKFSNHKLRTDDPFGYLTQIGTYLHASQNDPLVKDKDKASFVAVDKQLGHIAVDTYEFPDVGEPTPGADGRHLGAGRASPVVEHVLGKKQILSRETPPDRAFSDIPDGKSGNRKLGTECSYCPFKHACWPGLRTFNYSNGPTFLTKVEREPNVVEKTDGQAKKKF